MSRALTAQDRSSLIRLASSLPAGSPERKAILAGLNILEKQAYDKDAVLKEMILKIVTPITGGTSVELGVGQFPNMVSVNRAKKVWDIYAKMPEDPDDEKGVQKVEQDMEKLVVKAAAALTKKFGLRFELEPDGYHDFTESIGFNVDMGALRAKMPKYNAEEINEHAFAAMTSAQTAIEQGLLALGHSSGAAAQIASEAVIGAKLGNVLYKSLSAKYK